MDETFLRSRGRTSELAALLNPKVRQLLDEHRIQLVTFRASRCAIAPSSVVAATC
jgi:hypothetical protein